MNLKTKKKEEKKKIEITDTDIESSFATDLQGSNLLAVLYGFDGVGKTGCAMDCRREDEMDQTIYVLDCDGGALAIKKKYFGNDPNVKIFDPLTQDDEGNIDYATTYRKCLHFVRYIRQKERDGERIKAVIMDGIDSFLKNCEILMKIEDLKQDPTSRVKDVWSWEKRNTRFYQVVIPLTRMKCQRYFITHMKPLMDFVSDGKGGRALKVVGHEPVWEKTFPARMHQKIHLERIEEGDVIRLKATIEKSKTALELEGKEYNVAEITKDSASWKGLWSFYDDLGE